MNSLLILQIKLILLSLMYLRQHTVLLLVTRDSRLWTKQDVLHIFFPNQRLPAFIEHSLKN